MNMKLKEYQGSNGFRVLMSRNYVEHIADFIMGFLKSSKIQDNVKSLATCINDLVKTFSELSQVTQNLNNKPNMLSYMGVIEHLKQIYKNSTDNMICADANGELKKFIQVFISSPKIGNRDSNFYFNSIGIEIKNKSKRVYFELVRAYSYVVKGDYKKAGEVLGEFFYTIIRLKKLSNDIKDFEGSSSLISPSNENQFENDSNQFKLESKICVKSVIKILKDIYNLNSKDKTGNDVTPNLNDLVKSVVETNQLLQCFNNVGKIYDRIVHSNYGKSN